MRGRVSQGLVCQLSRAPSPGIQGGKSTRSRRPRAKAMGSYARRISASSLSADAGASKGKPSAWSKFVSWTKRLWSSLSG
jgi:hypothetical protein